MVFKRFVIKMIITNPLLIRKYTLHPAEIYSSNTSSVYFKNFQKLISGAHSSLEAVRESLSILEGLYGENFACQSPRLQKFSLLNTNLLLKFNAFCRAPSAYIIIIMLTSIVRSIDQYHCPAFHLFTHIVALLSSSTNIVDF